jgi:ribose transport system ATP-binding protein
VTVTENGLSGSTAAAPAVDCVGLSKRFGAVQALDQADLRIEVGEVIGLVGQNGAGKSTLVNILCGVVAPDEGTVRIHGKAVATGHPRAMADAGIAVVSQEQSLVEQLTVWENVYLGRELTDPRSGLLLRAQMKAGAAALFKRLGIGIDTGALVSDLPFASRQLVEIARAIHQSDGKAGAILVLDEPTSGLSPRETEVLFGLIQNATRDATFIFVSHVLPDILRLCSRVVVCTNGRLVADRGISDVTERDLHELMIGRARSSDYYALDRQGRAISDDRVLELVGGRRSGAFTDVNLTVRRGEVIGLAGIIGSGTSDVAAAIAGAVPLDAGQLKVQGRAPRRWSVREAIAAGVRYLPPERRRDALFPHASVAKNIAVSYLGEIRRPKAPLLDGGRESRLVGRLIQQIGLRPPDPRRMVIELSGGNQQKVVFARLLADGCVVAILDNPTRGVDVGTREEIYAMVRELAANGTGVILTSESIEELIGLSDRLVILRSGAVVTEIPSPPEAKPTELEVLACM